MKLGPIRRAVATAILLAGVPAVAVAAWTTERTFVSPDGMIRFTLERDDATGKFAWSVARDGAPVVTRGELGIVLATGTVGDGGSVALVEERTVDETWLPPYGENFEVRDHFREQVITISNAAHGSLAVNVEVRAYDEGVALRYRVAGAGPLTMTGEKTSFPVPTSAVAWVTSASQGAISRVAIGSVGSGVERPLTLELGASLYAALGEAGSLDHARMKFSRTGASTLVPALGGSSSFDNLLVTPWRYVRVATSPAGLLQGNRLMWNLSEPSRIADTSWLKPGKMLREITLTTAGGIACVDWAAQHGIDYLHIDAGWYGPENDPNSDATTVTVDPARSPGPLDLQQVINHARSKDVGVILYVNRRALETQLDEILPLYRQWGVAGIKFGFVQTGSQQWTKWLHESIGKCAQHQLMVNVHDDYRMTGSERTYPNFMSAEGIRGDEESPPNEMVLRTIFTRCLAGAGDQTNCYFASRVNTMGSHASQLAKSVCIYSPWQYLYWYDSPAASPNVGGKSSVLQDVPELSFFERLPTVWDETRWLDGHPESHATVARRKGERWFIGALNGTAAREFSIPLGFLPAGQNFRVELFVDDPNETTVTKVGVRSWVVNRDSVIVRAVGVRNGMAAVLTPTSDPLSPQPEDPPPPVKPPPPVGTIQFEGAEGYPAAGSTVAAKNSSGSDAPFDGINGWALSTSSSPSRIGASSNSGEYEGGQALGTDGSGTYIGAKRDVIRPAASSTITFDAQYNTGITVGFMKDNDGDGQFDSGDCGMGFGVGGATTVRFQRRNAAFGTETASPLAGTGGQWYRFTVTIGPSAGGSRNVTMAVRNLSTGADLDFDTTANGTQSWGFAVTDAAFGPAPEDSDGVFVRLTGSARIDNLRLTAVAPPYRVWIGDYPAISGPAGEPASDYDGDGLSNMLEFVLGGDPTAGTPSAQPSGSVSGSGFEFRFRRDDRSEGSAVLTFQHKVSLAPELAWDEVVIGASHGADGIVSWTVDEAGEQLDEIIVTVPRESGGRRFARLAVRLLDG